MNTRTIKAGTVDVSVVIRIVDSTDGTPETGVVYNTAGIDLQYRRELAASVAITEATLAALTTAHADGGFLHIGNGYYRLDLPDAACAAGATGVLVHGTVTGMVVIGCYLELPAYDPYDAVRLGLTALPNVASGSAGAIPTTGTGANQISVASGLVTLASVTHTGAVIPTVTTLTNLPAITSNWLTAAGIAASALNGKGDWNIGKTGYALSSAGVQAIWDALTSALTTVGSIGKKLADWTIGTAQTGDCYARLGAPAGASVSADVAAVKSDSATILADTNDIQTRLPAALVGGRMDSSVGAVASGVIAAASFDTTAGAFAHLGVVDQGTAQSATGTTLVLRAAAAFATSELVGSTLLITGGSAGVGQSRVITANDGATDTVTVDAFTTTPTGTITYKIFATPPASASAPASVSLTAAAVDAIWDEPTSGHGTAGTTGKALTDASSAGDPWSTALPGAYGAGTAGKIMGDNLNATVSSRASQTSVDTVDDLLDTEIAAIKSDTAAILIDTAEIGVAGAGLTNINLPDQTMNITGNITGNLSGSVGSVTAAVGITAAAVDAVWDEPTSGHTTAGTTGKALTDASSAGDPWSTALPGAYGAGTAGKIMGDNLNASVSSRASQASVDAVDDLLDTEVAAIKSDTAAILIDTAEIGAAGAGLTVLATAANLATVAGYLDTEIAAILVDTNELQTDWTNGGRLDLIIDAVKAKTDSLTFTKTNEVDSNIQSVNGVTLVGDGSATPFNV